jgi:hypothetical protein
LQYEKFVGQELERLGGDDSDEFRMNYMCEWRESRVIAINVRTFTEQALNDFERGKSPYGFQVAGLDVAKSHDSSVLTVMAIDLDNPFYNRTVLGTGDKDKQVFYKKIIIDWMEMQGAFEGGDGQYNQLVQYLMDTGVRVLVVDATTIGNPVYERIQVLLEGQIRVEPYIFSTQSKHILYKYYLQEMHAKRIFYTA